MKSVEHATSDIMLVREETSPKISDRASGLLGYRVCIEADESEVFLTITSNETSGYFSREYLPLSRIETAMTDAMSGAKSFPASRLKTVFNGKSANNASFLAAILRHEGLLNASPDNPLLSIPGVDIRSWKESVATLPRTAIEAAAPTQPAAPLHTKAEDSYGKTKGKKASKKKAVTEPSSEPEWVETTSEEGTEGTAPLPKGEQDVIAQESE